VSPQRIIAVTDDKTGNTITVECIHPDYIFAYADGGTPNEMFKIEQEPGRSATFHSLTNVESYANASLLADHITNMLAGLAQNSTTA